MDNVFCREYGLLIFSPVGWTLGIYFFCGKLVHFLKLEVRFGRFWSFEMLKIVICVLTDVYLPT